MKSPPTNIAGYDPTRDADGFTWDAKAAQHVVDFFSQCLHLTSGRSGGQPFIPQPWQRDYLATLFGWKRSDGTRRYRESLFFTPRKNGKTETGAGIALYALCCDQEQKPEVYSAAKTRDQASRVFEPASIMVRNDDTLRSATRVIESTKRVVFPRNNGYYTAISADAATAHGKNPHCVLFDELHTQPNRSLYDGLKSGMGARSQPLFISMTTAGYDRNSICYEVWKHACNVRDGIIRDPHFLPMLYQWEDGDDWQDESVWSRVNPNLGVTITLDFLREEFSRAKSSPAYENTFRNLYLNQWTEQAIRWLPMESWDCGSDPLPSFDGQPCYIGLDLSTTQDITAAVMAFQYLDGVALLPRFWIPEDTARERERVDRVPYRLWSQQGLVTMTPGSSVDYSWVRADLVKMGYEYQVQEIAADPWNAKQLLQQLSGDEHFNVVEMRQGFATMSSASKLFETAVIQRKVYHGGNPVLRWMAANVAIERDAAENIKPTKDKSTGRIDGIVAGIMANFRLACASQAPRGADLFVFG